MNPTERGQARSIRLRNYVWALVILWTTAFAFTLTWALIDKSEQDTGRIAGRGASAFRKDRGLLRWYAARGGVFVPAPGAAPTDRTKPEGDVRSGQRFVPVDASDMIREVHGFGHEESELRTHLVGLEPRHSANAPDAWEADALKRLAEGEPEVSSERTIRGKTFLQTMRPLIVEESCLKCHAERGYRVGELRGGISISVPFAPLWPLEKGEMLSQHRGLRKHVAFRTLQHSFRRTAVATPDRATHRDRGVAAKKRRPDDRGAATSGTSFSREAAQRSQGSTSPGRRFLPSSPAATTTITSPCPRCATRSLSAMSPVTGLAPHCSWRRHGPFCDPLRGRPAMSARY